jgi:hypothetical protein
MANRREFPFHVGKNARKHDEDEVEACSEGACTCAGRRAIDGAASPSDVATTRIARLVFRSGGNIHSDASPSLRLSPRGGVSRPLVLPHLHPIAGCRFQPGGEISDGDVDVAIAIEVAHVEGRVTGRTHLERVPLEHTR